MVIPWLGFELGDLLRKVEPQSSAKYVAFTTLLDEEQFPGQGSPFYPWPYTEGLRLDETMHRLTILATGLYGKELPNQNSAPLRLVVPWKYGFKSIKAIVRIDMASGRRSVWKEIAPSDPAGLAAGISRLLPTPDGRFYVYGTTRFLSELYVADGLR